MAVLYPDKRVFYHPCDSLTDGDGNLWTTPDPDGHWTGSVVFEAGGVIDNRFHGASGISAFTRPGFGNMLGGTRITWAAWMDLSVANSLTFIGFMGGGPGYRGSAQCIRLDKGGRVYLYTGDVDSGSPGDIVRWGTNTVNTPSGWHFYVLDARWVGGKTWALSHSVDGAAFTTESNLGWNSGPAGWVNSPTDAMIVSRDALVDEVILWRDLDELFTSAELQNLYDLANTYDNGMDQYTQQYPETKTIDIASDPSAVAITVSPNDSNGDGNGNTPFSRAYEESTDVTITAPAKSGNRVFLEWRNSSGNTVSSSRTLTITVTVDETYAAHYEFLGDSANDYSVASQ